MVLVGAYVKLLKNILDELGENGKCKVGWLGFRDLIIFLIRPCLPNNVGGSCSNQTPSWPGSSKLSISLTPLLWSFLLGAARLLRGGVSFQQRIYSNRV
jgi:hypothetical protein